MDGGADALARIRGRFRGANGRLISSVKATTCLSKMLFELMLVEKNHQGSISR